MRRIADRQGRIGYVNEKGAIIIKPQFAFGFPFKDGRAKVTNRGEKKVVPNSKGEYHYWESDKWFYIDKRGASLPQFSVMEWIPTQVVDDKEKRQYRIGFIGLARWLDNSKDKGGHRKYFDDRSHTVKHKYHY